MTKRKRTRSNGEGSVVKLGGKRKRPYAARITVGWTAEGRQMFKYINYFETKTLAKQALSNYLINPYDLDSSKLTAQDVFDKWSESTKISIEVVKAYASILNKSGFAKRIFKDIRLTDLETNARDLSPSMQKRYKACFKNLYLYAMKADIVNKNLADLMELDKYVAGKRDAISASDINEILKGDDVIPKILLYSGMRIGELIDIKSKNVDLEKRIIIGGKKTAAGTNRKIPIHKSLIPILEELLSKGTEYLITNEIGKKLQYSNYLDRVWNTNEVLKSYTPHFTRHTFVSRAVKLELNREVMKAAIGHASTEVTDIYTHIDEESLLQFIDKFEYN